MFDCIHLQGSNWTKKFSSHYHARRNRVVSVKDYSELIHLSLEPRAFTHLKGFLMTEADFDRNDLFSAKRTA